MCLILFAYKVHPEYKLVLAANRDEFYKRPTAPVDWWREAPSLLAGKDLEGGGTWMGITKKGKFAALTNYRGKKLPLHRENTPSRGKLVSDYLLSDITIAEFFNTLIATGAQYNGFNLIFGNPDCLYYFSNAKETNTPGPLEPGLYGLSNDILDTPWPKVERGKQQLEQTISRNNPASHLTGITGELFSILADRKRAPFWKLPKTGLGWIKERWLSPMFIKTPVYGTRSSSVLLIDKKNNVVFDERSFVPPAEKRCQFFLED
jgi:uncharacterized protein with NRDE domain